MRASRIPGRRAALLVLATLLCACAGSGGVAPIDDRPAPPSQELRLHMVSGGDTLYSIAFRYEKDFRELARLNNLVNYQIYPGQRLYLTEDAARRAGVSVGPAPIQQATPTSTANNTPSTAAAPSSPPQRPVASSQTPVGTSPSVVSAPSATMPPMAGDSWVWPHSGAIAIAFGRGSPASRGIQVNAEQGQAVAAAGDGLVVYAGAGLRGYGNLVIIKHDEVHLSAYGHNQELRVAEGDRVHAGQEIASVGTDPQGNHRLYFEIRRDGTPVDPIRYLPRR